MRTPFLPAAATVSSLLLLAACGGGDEASPPDAGTTAAAAAAVPDAGIAAARRVAPVKPPAAKPTPQPAPTAPAPTAGVPTDAQRAAAATTTANSTVNACNAVRPFYWEVGTASGAKASGSVRSSTSSTVYAASTPMPVASATKWLYGAYVVERRGGNPTATDRKYLAMQAGYVSMLSCDNQSTVDGCLAMGNNGDYTAAADGKFYYDGGHMQKHASLNGLGAMTARDLTNEVRSRLGADVPLTFTQARPGGGATLTPAAYGTFLRKVMNGSLRIGGLLGSQAACASPRTCGLQQAMFAPIRDDETFHYSLGHWIEDDPVLGDGAFSSAGLFGFYPWIDAGKTQYGVIGRVDQRDGAGWASMLCGRLIRKAFASGVAL